MLRELVSAVFFELFISHWNVGSDAESWLCFMKLFVATFKNVDLRVKELRVVLHVKPSIHFSEGLIHGRSSFLTELTVKDDNRLHELLYGLSIFEEEALHVLRVRDVDGILNVASVVLVIESAINDQIWACLVFNKGGKDIRSDRVFAYVPGLFNKF